MMSDKSWLVFWMAANLMNSKLGFLLIPVFPFPFPFTNRLFLIVSYFRYGTTLVTGYGRIWGHPVGIIANNGFSSSLFHFSCPLLN